MSVRIGLCLPGGGAGGAMFQIGALAALEDTLEGFEAGRFDVYVASSGGASVAAAVASGLDVQRMYRAFLDPADVYFGLERRHLLRIDLGEWKRALPALVGALGEGASGLMGLGSQSPSEALWEKLDRVAEALPAGLFTLDAYERFLEDFFIRRGVPNSFFGMKRPLRILAHDLDSAELASFGSETAPEATVTRACIASMAIPPFFSPVRIGSRHYVNPGAGQVVHADVAIAEGAEVLVVINPMVPLRLEPSESGDGSLRERGMLTIVNQVIRIGAFRSLSEQCRRAEEAGVPVLLVEPESTEGFVFLGNPASFEVRRRILEYAYRHTTAVVTHALDEKLPACERAGFARRTQARPSVPPS